MPSERRNEEHSRLIWCRTTIWVLTRVTSCWDGFNTFILCLIASIRDGSPSFETPTGISFSSDEGGQVSHHSPFSSLQSLVHVQLWFIAGIFNKLAAPFLSRGTMLLD